MDWWGIIDNWQLTDAVHDSLCFGKLERDTYTFTQCFTIPFHTTKHIYVHSTYAFFLYYKYVTDISVSELKSVVIIWCVRFSTYIATYVCFRVIVRKIHKYVSFLSSWWISFVCFTLLLLLPIESVEQTKILRFFLKKRSYEN